MATTSRLLLIASIFLSLLAIGANSRPGIHFHPCNTLFISFTISSVKSPHFRNPNGPNPSGFFTIFSVIREFNPKNIEFIDHDDRPVIHHPVWDQLPIQHSYRDDVVKPDIVRPMYLFGSFSIGSLREHTKDILSVLVSLLFGVGCGALTSATMYLAWSLIINRYGFNDSEREDEDGDDSDCFSDYDVKKMGYVKIPEDPIAAPAKEVV
ncbi:uncharacterized protein LOC122665861 [Telopea speciosissima]|uniref:uncharacterized protein LOC122665861 n=1 Tax=Telopea speciosissima TaxID=54955 RepID=UPI001CC6B2D0|nr:uncharacterized protein LOC122665861 [Telopea speciosissima]